MGGLAPGVLVLGVDPLVPDPDRRRLPRLSGEACDATPPAVEGPFWRPDAPFRERLIGPEDGGTPILVRGTVRGSRDCLPVPGALLDVWQADDEGHYDNDRDDHDASNFRLRGRLKTDGVGAYHFLTIRPAPYAVDGQFRPPHIHLKISAPSFATLTTQIYFEGDPYLDTDPLDAVKPQLVVRTEPCELGIELNQLGLDQPVDCCVFDVYLTALDSTAYLASG